MSTTTITSRRLATMLRATLTKEGRAGQALLDWADEHRSHFWPEPKATKKAEGKAPARRKLSWARLGALVEQMADDPLPEQLATAAANVASVLGFDARETAVLEAGLALAFHPRIARLRWALEMAHEDIARIAGLLSGSDAPHAGTIVRNSLAVELGLLEIEMASGGGVSLDVSWWFEDLLARGGHDPERLIEALAGKRQIHALALADFPALDGDVAFLARLLAGARAARAPGVNILLHGPPGVGKTELARALAADIGATLFAVGETDRRGTEPRRDERMAALLRAQRALERDAQAILLFDEMEDMIGNAEPAGPAKRFANRAGSKIFVNRLLETNVVPVIWTTNAVDNIDTAYLRRMSFVLKLDHPRGADRQRMLARVASSEGCVESDALAALARRAPETTSVARVAMRAARIAGAEAGDEERTARALVIGVTGQPLPVIETMTAADLSLFESDPPVADLVAGMTRADAPLDFSLLLAGPPGTGKTLLAGEIAERLARPLMVKRASDLISKWVGESEQNIAAAFREARAEGAVLMFDEADSLLFDRQGAVRSWEVMQVNELLTWLDRHPLPVIAATNALERLDPAVLRRFAFKVTLQPLGRTAAARAFARFFGIAPPPGLARLSGLTPGDFAVVARQLRFTGMPQAAALVDRLEAELAVKPGAMAARLGF